MVIFFPNSFLNTPDSVHDLKVTLPKMLREFEVAKIKLWTLCGAFCLDNSIHSTKTTEKAWQLC
jgi:hypothetical protein